MKVRCTGLLTAVMLLAIVELGAAEPAAQRRQPQPDGLIASPEPDWPQWRGPRRDGVSDERGLLRAWPEGGPRLLWKIGKLGRGWSSPIIVGDTLYITGEPDDELIVYAYDLGGNPKWKCKNGKAWHGSYPGARACCAFSEGQLYHMNAFGRVACLDAANGNEVWAVDVLERFGGEMIRWAMAECLLVDGPRVLVTPGGKKAVMAALDKRDGKTVWTTEPIAGDAATYTSPVLFRYAGRRLVAQCSATHGFGADADSGKLLWTVPCKNRTDVIVATPVYADGCVFYVTADGPNGTCYRLRAEGDGTRAEQAWHTPLDTVTGGTVLADGCLFGSGYSEVRHWLSIDWRSGRTQYEIKELVAGAAIYADGRLYCLCQDGTMALVRPGKDDYEIAGRFRLTPERAGDSWAHPVVCGGRLYLRLHDTLWCYDIRAK